MWPDLQKELLPNHYTVKQLLNVKLLVKQKN